MKQYTIHVPPIQLILLEVGLAEIYPITSL